MKNKHFPYINNIILPCVLFSSIAGALTGGVIFAFKLMASRIIDLSATVYDYVRGHAHMLPYLLLGCVIIGLISALLLSLSKNSRGGGIPTSVAILRGLISFHWVNSLILLPISAMLTYLVGVPLGNEGPSVQMGTAVGKGTVKLFSKKHAAWNRYIMTGGASAGFATATGAPVSGIFFALEEAHRRFSPMLIMVASTSVISGSLVMNALCSHFGISPRLFHFTPFPPLPAKSIWISVVLGIACGCLAGFFTYLYKKVNVLVTQRLKKVPFAVKMATVFLATGIVGFAISDCLGSGHSLIEWIIEGNRSWYALLLVLAIRLLLLILANNVGVTGGLFIPTLAFGAIIGSIVSNITVTLGLIPQEYYATVIIIAIVSFLSAFVRTPITAIIFSVEALGAYENILPVIIAVIISYIIVEALAIECFYETVIHAKVKEENRDRESSVLDDYFTVQEDSFIVGKELRDILWPPSCIVLSVERAGSGKSHSDGPIMVGDRLHIHATTYNEKRTLFDLKTILG
ncbi:MAG: chloride channel protein [Clostridia bacterium]|nr:chloride channel protein [Clostridia bacterium]